MGSVCGHRPPGFSFGNFLCLGSVIAPAAKACAYKFNTILKNIRQAMKCQVHPSGCGYPKLLGYCDLPFQPTKQDPLNTIRPVVCYPGNPLIWPPPTPAVWTFGGNLITWRRLNTKILIQTTFAQKSGMHPSGWVYPEILVCLSAYSACLPGRPPASRPRSLGEHARISDAPGVKMDFPGWSVPKWG